MKKLTPLYTLLALMLFAASYGQNSFPASGPVGIGTLTPDSNYALDINGALNATEINVTNLLVGGNPMQSSPWSLNGNNISYSNGSVGIGTNTPNYALDIVGTLNATTILLNGTPLEGSPSPWVTIGNNLSYTAGDVEVTTLNAANISLNGSTLISSPWTIAGSNLSYTAGNVDVTTLNAASILLNGTPLENSPSPWTITGSDISYTAGDVNVSTLNATNISLNGSTLVSSPWTITGSDLSYSAGTIDVGTLDATTLRINGTDVVSSQWTSSGEDLSYTTGNIGIGTAASGYALDVAGTINATDILINGSPLPSGDSPWNINGNDTFYSTGNVGIGTNTPGFALDVAGTINATNILINGSPLPSGSSPWTTSGNDLSYTTGNVGIGTNNTQGYMLAVGGNMVAEGVKVELQGNWPDFVFEKDFDLQSLMEIEAYIKKNGHLPNVPSAEEIKNNGINLGEMNATLLQKIEELTLHSIQQQKEIDSLKGINQKLSEQNKLILSLQKRLLKLESKNN